MLDETLPQQTIKYLNQVLGENAVHVAQSEVVNTWKLHFAHMGFSPIDIENLAQQIDGDYLLQHRTSFESQRFISLPIKRLRKGPFSAT